MSSGASRRHSFGDRAFEPASPGSYGVAPSGFRLPPETRLGPVCLRVADLERSRAFYEEVLGMRTLLRSGGGNGSRAALGAGGSIGAEENVLLELEEWSGARPAPGARRTGLYHFAVLLPDRASLGRFAQHAVELGLELGAGDHLVSESLYLADADGLGIEIYADRARDTWRRSGRELVMATDPLDLGGLLREAEGNRWTGMPAGAALGHVHLHVGDLAGAARFYSEALGFDRVVWSYPGALFLSAGGYHHHLGANVWAGRGATAPPADEAQLRWWTIELPDASSLRAAAASFAEAGFPASGGERGDDENAVETRDPWGTRVRLHVASGVHGISGEPA